MIKVDALNNQYLIIICVMLNFSSLQVITMDFSSQTVLVWAAWVEALQATLALEVRRRIKVATSQGKDARIESLLL